MDIPLPISSENEDVDGFLMIDKNMLESLIDKKRER
jgi:hypothetical protein